MIKKKFKELKESEEAILRNLSEKASTWFTEYPKWEEFIKKYRSPFRLLKEKGVKFYMKDDDIHVELKSNGVRLSMNDIRNCLDSDCEILEEIKDTKRVILHERHYFKEYLRSWIVAVRDDWKEFVVNNITTTVKKIDPNKMENKIDIFNFDFEIGIFRAGIYSKNGDYYIIKFIGLEEI